MNQYELTENCRRINNELTKESQTNHEGTFKV